MLYEVITFRPDIIMVTPSYMLAIGDQFVRQGYDPRECSLRVGIFGAEPWTESMRSEIEDRFGIDAIDIYGLSEVIGPGVSQECVETKDGLHVWEDHFRITSYNVCYTKLLRGIRARGKCTSIGWTRAMLNIEASFVGPWTARTWVDRVSYNFV